jgi:hypothetical protein
MGIVRPSNFENQMEPPPMETNYALQNVFGSAFAVSFMSWLLKNRFKEIKEFQNTQFLLSKLAGKEGCIMILVIHSVFLQLFFLSYWQKLFKCLHQRQIYKN